MRRYLYMAASLLAATPHLVAQPYSPKPKYERELLRFNSWPMDIESVAVSPDGKFLAVGTAGWKGKEPKLHIVDATTGKALRTISEHQNEITALAFSQDSQLLFSGSKDTTIGIWEVATGKEVKRLDGHRDRVTALAVSEDGKRLVSCTGWSRASKEYQEFRIWDLEKGKTIKQIPIPAPVRSRSSGGFMVKIAPDLSFAMLIVRDPSYGDDLFVVDLVKGGSTSLTWKSDQKYSYVKACAISADGKVGVSAHDDLKIRFWNLTTRKLLREVQAPRQKVIGLAFSSDGSRLALDQEDGSVKVWDAKTDAEQFRTEATGGKSFIGWGDILFAPSGRWLVTTSGSYCFLWDLPAAK